MIEQDGTHYVPVFTSEDKMRAAGADPETALSVPLAGLAAGWPGEELWLAIDPASEEGLALPPDAVRALPGFLEDAAPTRRLTAGRSTHPCRRRGPCAGRGSGRGTQRT